MAESGHFRGAGNVIWELALPLNEVMQEQLTKGYLRRVNADGSPYVEPSQEQDSEDSAPDESPPASNASKAHWVGYAHRIHGVSIDEAEALTKNDLMELYGSKA